MQKATISIIFLGFTLISFGQPQDNIFKNYQEFRSEQPSDYCDFQLKQRSNGSVFMNGGITNFRLKKIKPPTRAEELTRSVWGVLVDNSVYINSYLYSDLLGFNKILDDGYYPYFIGEPARIKFRQMELGIIKASEPQKSVCCKTSYVILRDGKVKWLTPELLSKLVDDHKELKAELQNDNLKQEDAVKMFEYLRRYNKSKQ